MTERLGHHLFKYILLEHSLRVKGVHYKMVLTCTLSKVMKFQKGFAGAWSQGGVVPRSGGQGVPSTQTVPWPMELLPVSFVDDMAELLLGESKLEQHLKEQPLRQGASPRGPRPQLTEVRKHLTATLDRGNLKVLWDEGGQWGGCSGSTSSELCGWGGSPQTNWAMFRVRHAARASRLRSRPAPCTTDVPTPRLADHLVGASAQ